MDDNLRKTLYMYAILFLVIGGINWGLVGTLNRDLVKMLFKNNTNLQNVIYILIGLSALYVAFDRNTYLPFLGDTVLPCSMINETHPEDSTLNVTINTKPDAKVIYWASTPKNRKLMKLQNWKSAYNEFENSGVAIADHDGLAILKLKKPQPYKVRNMKLDPHIHYRVCNNSGMMDQIKTIYV